MNYIETGAAVTAVWNIVVFIVYGMDKWKAKRDKWRTSEKTLLLLAAFMGGAGALLSMSVFRHKTKHLKFKAGVPLLLILNIVVAVACVRFLSGV